MQIEAFIRRLDHSCQCRRIQGADRQQEKQENSNRRCVDDPGECFGPDGERAFLGAGRLIAGEKPGLGNLMRRRLMWAVER